MLTKERIDVINAIKMSQQTNLKNYLCSNWVIFLGLLETSMNSYLATFVLKVRKMTG